MFGFNCGGFALKNYEWYEPYTSPYVAEALTGCGVYNEELILEHCINVMLEEFDNLRLIDNEEEADDDEVVIFFRIGLGDFHFVRKERNGRYYHKMGNIPAIYEMDKEEVYSEYGWVNERYDSRLIIFAYKDDTNDDIDACDFLEWHEKEDYVRG